MFSDSNQETDQILIPNHSMDYPSMTAETEVVRGKSHLQPLQTFVLWAQKLAPYIRVVLHAVWHLNGLFNIMVNANSAPKTPT